MLPNPTGRNIWDEMVQTEKDAFKKMLDRNFPPHPAIVAKANEARAFA